MGSDRTDSGSWIDRETDGSEFGDARLNVLPPIGKARRYPPLSLTVIHASEIDPPEGRKPIDWKLLTDLPVETPAEVIEKMALT